MHRAAAVKASAENRYEDAAVSFEKALEATPANLELVAGLGNVYIVLKRYRDAIDVFERVLPRVVGKGSAIPMMLALAYVAEREDRNAATVLRMDGRNERQIADDLQALQRLAERRLRFRTSRP